MKVQVEIDVNDIFSFTTQRQDEEIADIIIDKASDGALIAEVLRRGLLDDVFDESSSETQEAFMESKAEDYGYTRQ